MPGTPGGVAARMARKVQCLAAALRARAPNQCTTIFPGAEAVVLAAATPGATRPEVRITAAAASPAMTAAAATGILALACTPSPNAESVPAWT